MKDERTLADCPFCGETPEKVGAFAAQCRGMVNGKEVHNTIVMNNAAWNRRPEAAQALRSQPSVEEVARVIDPEVWADNLPVPTRIDVIAFHFRRQDSVARARQIKALYEEKGG